MFYLEDLAYEVKTSKFIKVRGIIITIFILLFMIGAVSIYIAKNRQNDIIQSNLVEIAGYQ